MTIEAEATLTEAIDSQIQQSRRGIFAGAWYLLRRYPVIPSIILVVMLTMAVIGPYVAPFPRDEGYLPDRNQTIWSRSKASTQLPIGSSELANAQAQDSSVRAGWQPCDPAKGEEEQCGKLHVFGADHAGRDIFSRLLHGSRISVAIVAFSLTTGMILGTAVGLFSGYYGGVLDELVTRFVDIWNALPFLMVALLVIQLFGAKIQVLFWTVDMLMFVLMLIAWVGFVRVIRAEVFVLRELDFVAAARVAGSSDIRIILRHLTPGVLNTMIVVASLSASGLVLAESVLSFVGAGIQPPTPAWGVMTNQGRDYFNEAPHISLVPGTAIFFLVLALNFLGDWLRDRLDPRLRQIA